MRRARPAPSLSLLLGLGALFASTHVHAQMASSTFPVSCQGMGAEGTLNASIGIAASKNPKEAPTTVYPGFAQYMFSKAECECDTHDIFMRVQLTHCLDSGAASNPTVWVGSNASCTNYTTRTTTNQTACQQTQQLDPTAFSAGGGNCNVSTPFDVVVPSRPIFSPNKGACDITSASNQAFIFVGTDQSMPLATCTLPFTEQGQGPSAPVDASPSSGDGAVTLSWHAPPAGSAYQPQKFQILCADANGKPIPDKLSDNVYSTCLADGIRRRKNIYGTGAVTPTTDGGVATTDGGVGTASSALSQPGGSGPDPRVTDDMGTDDMGTGDMAVSGGTTLSSGIRASNSGLGKPFDTLDPAFVCSNEIIVNGRDYSPRIDGLINEQEYQFVILSIDAFGNATPSPVLFATPHAVDNLYSRYRSEGGKAQGFCFVATAAFGDYDHPQVRVLRAFRDRILEGSAAGHAFVRAYYAMSPPLARFIAEGTVRRAIARAILWPLVGLAALALELGSLTLALLVAVGGPGLVLWLRRRRRRALLEVAA